MKRMLSLIAGLASVWLALTFGGPVGARTPPRGCFEANEGRSSVSGRQVFMRNCARCHGADARGKKGPALAGRTLNQDEIQEMVGAGQPPKMPAFGKHLSAAEIKAVAAYVSKL
jgi:cytochrome c oxidase cbb3-type subunit III